MLTPGMNPVTGQHNIKGGLGGTSTIAGESSPFSAQQYSIAGADGLFSAEYKHQYETGERHRAEDKELQLQSLAEERQWQEQMSNTQLQRLMADAQSAGINPLYLLGAGAGGSHKIGSVGTASPVGNVATAREQFELPPLKNPQIQTALINGTFRLLGEFLKSLTSIAGML